MAGKKKIENNYEVEIVEKKITKKQEEPKRIISKDEYVEVANNTIGELTYINSRTLAEWHLNSFGDIDEMQVSDLVTMKSSQPKLLTEGWLVIQDNDVVNHLHLNEVYKHIIRPCDLNDFFKLSEKKIAEFIVKAPSGMKKIIGQKAKEKIENGELDSITKQRTIETALGITLINSEN